MLMHVHQWLGNILQIRNSIPILYIYNVYHRAMVMEAYGKLQTYCKISSQALEMSLTQKLGSSVHFWP